MSPPLPYPTANSVSENTNAERTCPTCGRPISAAPAAPGISALRPNSEASLEATVASVGPTREVDTSRGPAEVADTGPVLRTPSALPGLR